MAIARKDQQVLSYLKLSEREELDAAAAEAEVSRADWIRQAVLDSLGRRREQAELVASLGDFVVVDDQGDTARAVG